ncbi:MAG: hypothetical protein CMO74_15910 [Verrucomicrobiales bacterium]|nr:hypothetical protein [Verrucomicrobiales bacterium]
MIDAGACPRYAFGMKAALFPLFLFVACTTTLVAADKPVVVEVAGVKFTAPAQWASERPASRMRAAQFKVPGPKDLKPASCVFFYFGPGGAGGAEANVKRWLGQFAPAPKVKSDVKSEKIGGVGVTHLIARGTYLDGPPFGGAKIPRKDYAMRGVIIMAPRGAIFIKMTGPNAVVEGAEKALTAMVQGALKK